MRRSPRSAPAASAKPRARGRWQWREAWQAALGGGVPGAAAMVLQVLLLCWLRAIVHYQQAKGGSMVAAARAMYAQGGVLRFYQGAPAALVQAPLCRFGDTAAQAGALHLLAPTRVPLPAQTAVASAAAAAWRFLLTPVETMKLLVEVEGARHGLELLRSRVAREGAGALYSGALAGAAAAAAAHWPWFLTHTWLTRVMPAAHTRPGALWRSAAAGFAASVASDVFANPARVLKAQVVTASGALSYSLAFRGVWSDGGPVALLTRGLGAKLCANALQGLVFSVLWRMCQDALDARRARAAANPRITVIGIAQLPMVLRVAQ